MLRKISVRDPEDMSFGPQDRGGAEELLLPLLLLLQGGLVVASAQGNRVNLRPRPSSRRERTAAPDVDIVRVRSDAKNVTILTKAAPILRAVQPSAVPLRTPRAGRLPLPLLNCLPPTRTVISQGVLPLCTL